MIRIIIKVPDSVQTGCESWCDISHYETFDIESPELEAVLSKHPSGFRVTVVGAEVKGDRLEELKYDPQSIGRSWLKLLPRRNST
jgi:hypothetical protein